MSAPPQLFAAANSGRWSRFFQWRGWCAAIVATLIIATPLLAATLHTVSQKGRSFSRAQVTIARSDSILFTNEDEFLHQIYVDSKGMTFDSNEQPSGQTIEVYFPRSGTFPVRCHIHPKMLLIVHVE